MLSNSVLLGCLLVGFSVQSLSLCRLSAECARDLGLFVYTNVHWLSKNNVEKIKGFFTYEGSKSLTHPLSLSASGNVGWVIAGIVVRFELQ